MQATTTTLTSRTVAAKRLAVPRADWILAALVGVVSLLLAAHALGSTSIWFDEAYSVELAKTPLWNIARYAVGPNGNMAVYYVILHFWLALLQLVGAAPTETLVRLPSAIFAGLGGCATYALGLRFRGRAAAIVAGLLYAVNVLQLTDAQEARAYSLQVLLTCIGWYALFAAITADRRTARRWWIGYTAVMVCAVLTHFFTDLVLAGQWVAVLGLIILPNPLRESARQSWRRMVTSSVVILVLTLPFVLVGMVRGGSSAWILPATPQDLVALFGTLSGQSPLYLAALGAACVLAVVPAAWWHRTFARRRSPAPLTDPLVGMDAVKDGQAHPRSLSAWLLVAWVVVPLALAFVLTQPALNLHLFYVRYFDTLVPPLCLLAGVGVAQVRWRPPRVLAAVGLIALGVAQAPAYYATVQHQDFRSAAAWLATHYAPGDGLACYSAMQCVVPLQYYLDAYPSPAHFDRDSPGNYDWTHVNHPNVLALSGSYLPINATTMATYAAHHLRIILAISTINTTGKAINVDALAQGDPDLKGALDWLRANESLQDSMQAGAVLFLVYVRR